MPQGREGEGKTGAFRLPPSCLKIFFEANPLEVGFFLDEFLGNFEKKMTECGYNFTLKLDILVIFINV